VLFDLLRVPGMTEEFREFVPNGVVSDSTVGAISGPRRAPLRSAQYLQGEL